MARAVVCRLSHSHRLPPVLCQMLQSVYKEDDITLTAVKVDSSGPVPEPADGSLSSALRAIWSASQGLFLVKHDGKGDGKSSKIEQQVIEELLRARNTEGSEKEQVGIIASHKLQRASLQGLLAGMEGMEDVQARTVDEFQVSLLMDTRTCCACLSCAPTSVCTLSLSRYSSQFADTVCKCVSSTCTYRAHTVTLAFLRLLILQHQFTNCILLGSWVASSIIDCRPFPNCFSAHSRAKKHQQSFSQPACLTWQSFSPMSLSTLPQTAQLVRGVDIQKAS